MINHFHSLIHVTTSDTANRQSVVMAPPQDEISIWGGGGRCLVSSMNTFHHIHWQQRFKIHDTSEAHRHISDYTNQDKFLKIFILLIGYTHEQNDPPCYIWNIFFRFSPFHNHELYDQVFCMCSMFLQSFHSFLPCDLFLHICNNWD